MYWKYLYTTNIAFFTLSCAFFFIYLLPYVSTSYDLETCRVEKFYVEPAFACFKECLNEKADSFLPKCQETETDILDSFSPKS